MTSVSDQLIGYVTPRPFGQFSMPVPAQNSCLREYAKNHGFIYSLPQCEHIFKGCFVQFFGTLNECKPGGHVVMYSSLMLPDKHSDLQMLKSIIIKKNITIHTVLERKKISKLSNFDDNQNIDLILTVINKNSEGNLKRHLPNTPRTKTCLQS